MKRDDDGIEALKTLGNWVMAVLVLVLVLLLLYNDVKPL